MRNANGAAGGRSINTMFHAMLIFQLAAVVIFHVYILDTTANNNEKSSAIFISQQGSDWVHEHEHEHEHKHDIHITMKNKTTALPAAKVSNLLPAAASDAIGKEGWGDIASYDPDTFTSNLVRTKTDQDIANEFCSKTGRGREGNWGYNALVKIRKGVIEAQKKVEGEDEEEGMHQSKHERQQQQQQQRPRILCMIYTYSKKNEKLIEAIVNTWGNKCDGFFAASNYTNRELGILNVPHRGEESYNNMWQKVRSMWAFAYDNYLGSYDYFHICGDDAFVVVDNLRSYLQSTEIESLLNGTKPIAFHPKYETAWDFDKYPDRPLLLGQPLMHGKQPPAFPLGGPGYTLNRAALKLFGSKINRECILANNTDAREDIFMASCFFLSSYDGDNPVLVVDTRDADNAFRYLPMSPNLHARSKPSGFQLKNKKFGFELIVGLDSISNQSVAFHLQDTVPKSILSPRGDGNDGNGDGYVDRVSLRSDVLEESIYRHHALLFNLCNW